MIEKIVEIKTAAGAMETFTVAPGAGTYPPVIVYMDAPGIREELYDFARRIAGQGYFVLLPDMYYRRGRLRFDLSSIDEATRGQMFGAMRSLDNRLVMEDTKAMLDFLDASPSARPGPRGCIGYCMSGQYVVSAAGTYPETFAASASLYGVGIVTDKPDSPHLLASRIKGELYLGFAEEDEYVPDNVIPDLKAALDTGKVAYRLDVWPGTRHGFCFPQRATYAEKAAEGVWEVVFDMYRRRLKPGG
ncbi:MAG: dienelactone hydrolase family protein [Parvibaculum sp.]|uniref:dienelactone hydrolase family protein n=1 Tax=Parvibaculum sp. TaxID=2024848 RepID=UPI0025F908A7|nr:dienelactone hydrolase family protein [Parvibaculum sp.]MCE9650112.1 dienelactone hydrolase family protein [Parvibaculum sp.]